MLGRAPASGNASQPRHIYIDCRSVAGDVAGAITGGAPVSTMGAIAYGIEGDTGQNDIYVRAEKCNAIGCGCDGSENSE